MNDIVERLNDSLSAGYSELRKEAAVEIMRLRAKIEAMKRQKPVGRFIQHPSNGLWEQDGYGDNPDARPLYALPGAQPAPSVPDEIERDVLRACCGTFHGSRHRITCEKYKGKREPGDKP